jgi:hypothetical protein
MGENRYRPLKDGPYMGEKRFEPKRRTVYGRERSSVKIFLFPPFENSTSRIAIASVVCGIANPVNFTDLNKLNLI